jgi:hypothetical protein
MGEDGEDEHDAWDRQPITQREKERALKKKEIDNRPKK